MADSSAPAMLIHAEELHVVYQRGAQPAVDGVTLTLGPGDGLLLTGEHGAGKSTVLRALAGLVRFGGAASVCGHFPGTPQATARIGYAPQGRGFANDHTPRHLVGVVATLRTRTRDAEAVDRALRSAGIDERSARTVTTDLELVRRVALACALVADPDVLILDDPWEFSETVAAIDAIRLRGGAVIAASHDPGGLPQILGRSLRLVEGVPA